MNLLLEADRIDDKLKECSLSESIFAIEKTEKSKGSQTTIRAQSEVSSDTPDTVNEIVDAFLDGTLSLDGCTFFTDTSMSSETVPDDCTLHKKRKLCSDSTDGSPDVVMSSTSTSAARIIDQNDEQKQKYPFKTRLYSRQKRVGSRCYARWSENGSFFWGFITKAMGHGLHRKYSVRNLNVS